MKPWITPRMILAAVALALAPGFAAAQAPSESESPMASVLRRDFPDLYQRLLRIERAHGILYGGLLSEGEEVRASGSDLPTLDFEFEMYDRLAAIVDAEGDGGEFAGEAVAGYAVLGERGAEVIQRANAFHREVLEVFADPAITDRSRALDEAVERYLSRPEVALPAEPKDMDILYDHPYTWAFRTGYPDVGGLIWAGHWYRLAATEPLMTFGGREERIEGLSTVEERFGLKLSFGEPPESFPTELPLTPPIAPGLVAMHPRAAVILDNLSMMEDVLADILVSPEVEDVHAALDQAIEQFVDPGYRIVSRSEWLLMALRHSIFNQGGPALGVMTQTERNTSGHAQHFQGGGRITFPGME